MEPRIVEYKSVPGEERLVLEMFKRISSDKRLQFVIGIFYSEKAHIFRILNCV
jgi:hypothetical protein